MHHSRIPETCRALNQQRAADTELPRLACQVVLKPFEVADGAALADPFAWAGFAALAKDIALGGRLLINANAKKTLALRGFAAAASAEIKYQLWRFPVIIRPQNIGATGLIFPQTRVEMPDTSHALGLAYPVKGDIEKDIAPPASITDPFTFSTDLTHVQKVAVADNIPYWKSSEAALYGTPFHYFSIEDAFAYFVYVTFVTGGAEAMIVGSVY